MQPASPFSAVPYDDDGPSGSHPRHRRRLFSNHSRHHLDFPYKENAIARRAQAPGATELSYQLGDDHAAQADALLADLPTSPRTQPLEEHADDSEAAEEARAAEAKRRRSARLATRLQEVFGLEEEEEVLEELPCWLLRSVSEYTHDARSKRQES
jgi:sterol 3beta-glucosyltransferase